MVELSKRAIKLLARVRAGEYYPAYDERTPKAMAELVEAGLVGTCGRSPEVRAYYVPVGYQPGREAFPSHRHKKGGIYTVLHAEALHTETEELMVVYANPEGKVFVRPKAMFDEPGRFVPLTPCIGVCRMEGSTCAGCGRSLDEITLAGSKEAGHGPQG